MPNQITKAILYALAGHSLFSFTHVIMKYVSADLNAFAIAFWNDVFALIAVLLFAKPLGGLPETLKSKHKSAHILRSFFLTIGFIFIVIALANIPIANVNSMTFTAPLFGTLISIVILREKAHPYHWMALIAGFLGILLILRPGFQDINPYHLAALAAALCMAIGMIFNRKIPGTETKLSFALYPIMVTFVVTGLLLLTDFQMPTLKHLALLSVSGSIASFAVICVGKSLAMAKIATVGAYEYIQMLWAITFGFIFFGDIISPLSLAGAGLIIAGGILLVTKENGKKNI